MDMHLTVFICSISAFGKYPKQGHSQTMKIPSPFVQTFFLVSDWMRKPLIILLSNERVFKIDLKLPSEGGELQ